LHPIAPAPTSLRLVFFATQDATVGETDWDITITPLQLRRTGVTYEAGLPGTEPTNLPEVTGRLLGPLDHAEPYAEDVHARAERRVITGRPRDSAGRMRSWWFRGAERPKAVLGSWPLVGPNEEVDLPTA
jgi:hypothetical protein